MATISLSVRYCDLNPPTGTPWREENFELKGLVWKVDPAEAALVMVDVWDIHPYQSHLERGAEITEKRILPVVEMCRKVGITVVHAPSPGQAPKYPQWVRYAGDKEIVGAGGGAADAWPPAELRSRTGKYAKFAKPKSKRREKWLQEKLPERKIMPAVEPHPDDFVIANGDQLQRLLHHRKVLHLFYAGFAANMCVLHRDYGICAMQRRGYNIILLRDCTTAIESAETFPQMMHTKASVSIVEMVFGASATSADLLKACRKTQGRKRR